MMYPERAHTQIQAHIQREEKKTKIQQKSPLIMIHKHVHILMQKNTYIHTPTYLRKHSHRVFVPAGHGASVRHTLAIVLPQPITENCSLSRWKKKTITSPNFGRS